MSFRSDEINEVLVTLEDAPTPRGVQERNTDI